MHDRVVLKHLSLASQCPVTEIIGEAHGFLVPMQPPDVAAAAQDTWQYCAVHFPHVPIPGIGDEVEAPMLSLWDVLADHVIIDNKLRAAERVEQQALLEQTGSADEGDSQSKESNLEDVRAAVAKSKSSTDALKELDYIGVYFAAHWAPESKQFTPILVKSYSKIHEVVREKHHKHRWDIIYVSAERSQDDYDAVFAEMPWKALPFNDDRTEALRKMFGVDSPTAQSTSFQPRLAIVDAKSGEIVSANVCDKLQQDHDAEGFPWPDEKLQESGGKPNHPPLVTGHVVVKKAVLCCDDGLSAAVPDHSLELHVSADACPDSMEPFAGDCGGFVRWRLQRWDQLDEKSQEAAQVLGYNGTRWESGVDSPELTSNGQSYLKLSRKQQRS